MENKKEFSPSQKKVIRLDKGYNIVLAGPGCGKTDVLAERIARAYEENGLQLEDALCLTFTNRAARGMFKRISKRLNEDSSSLFVGNIHRYCSQFLFNEKVVPQDTVIVDELEIGDILKSEIDDESIKDLIDLEGPDYYGNYTVNWYNIQRLYLVTNVESSATGKIQKKKCDRIISTVRMNIYYLSHLMNQAAQNHPEPDLMHKELWIESELRLLSPTYSEFQKRSKKLFNDEDLTSKIDLIRKQLKGLRKSSYDKYQNKDLIDGLLKELYLTLAAKFHNYKQRNNLLDFDDLLIRTYDAYRLDTERKYKRFPWVQVDEVQDLSNFQISLVDLFTDTSKDFVTVYFGDEQQAIYSFMGASLSTLEFLKDRCETLVRLDKNYRSPKYLLDLYNDYAIKELNVSKDLLPEPKDNQEAQRHDICFHVYDDHETEVERVTKAILPFLNKTQSGDERTAILVPWNNDASEISEILTRNDIEHFRISGHDTFQTVSIRLLFAHLNVVYNDLNMISWARILQTTYAVDTMRDGYRMVERMRNLAMTPSDLLRDDNQTYISDFCQIFDNNEIVIFDTETTGLDIANDDIVQIAAVKVRNGKLVPNSSFNIFLYTDKKIPEKLGGGKENPMVKAYQENYKYSRKEGFERFLAYIEDCPLFAHNANYDHNILKYNLARVSPTLRLRQDVKIVDSLKLARLLVPRLFKYKLEYLLEVLHLEGKNSHMADDDILATFELIKYCRAKSETILAEQLDYLNSEEVAKAKEELDFQYKDCYWHTTNQLFVVNPSEKPALVAEMDYAYKYLTESCEVRPTKLFDSYVLKFIENDVIEKDEQNMLAVHLGNHLMDLGTYRESDMCESTVMTDRLFVSTVHKAKGLEFENVVVMRVVDGRYPKFYSKTKEQKEEDKRLLYVAMSRAMKRLVITSNEEEGVTPFMENVVNHFCLRYSPYRNMDAEVLIDIKGDSLILTTQNSVGHRLKFEYQGLSRLQMNVLQIKRALSSLILHFSEAKEVIDGFFRKWGIFASEK